MLEFSLEDLINLLADSATHRAFFCRHHDGFGAVFANAQMCTRDQDMSFVGLHAHTAFAVPYFCRRQCRDFLSNLFKLRNQLQDCRAKLATWFQAASGNAVECSNTLRCVRVPANTPVKVEQQRLSRVEFFLKYKQQVTVPRRWCVDWISSERLQHDETKSKRVDFWR